MLIGLKYLSKTMKDYKNCCLRVKFRAIKDELKYAWQRAWHGYDDLMVRDIDDSFIELYISILQDFRNNLHSHPVNMTLKEWENTLDEMIKCLIHMDKAIQKCFGDLGIYQDANKYKDRFFELLSKHFYNLWD